MVVQSEEDYIYEGNYKYIEVGVKEKIKDAINLLQLWYFSKDNKTKLAAACA